MQPDPASDDPSETEHDGPYFAPVSEAAYGGEWPDVAPDELSAPASPRRGSRSRHVVREVVETGLLAVLVFLCVRATFGTYNVEGRSMDPTLEDGEFLFVSKLQYAKLDLGRLSAVVPFLGSDGYLLGPPSRGHVVVLKDPRLPAEKDLVKRIIGLPGETVEIANGRVYINGRLLDGQQAESRCF